MSTDSISLVSDRTEWDGTQDALRLQEEQLRLVIDDVPALISYVDSEQCYQFTNKRYEEWFGHSREEVQGKHLQEILGQAAYEKILPHAVASDITFQDASEVGTSNTASFVGGIPATSLNISSCGGERFGVKVHFTFNAMGTTVTSVDSTGSSQFAVAPSPIDNSYVEYFGNDNPPYTITYLRKVSSSGTHNFTLIVQGTVSGRSFTQHASVSLNCQ